jgi:hypothetical protein
VGQLRVSTSQPIPWPVGKGWYKVQPPQHPISSCYCSRASIHTNLNGSASLALPAGRTIYSSPSHTKHQHTQAIWCAFNSFSSRHTLPLSTVLHTQRCWELGVGTGCPHQRRSAPLQACQTPTNVLARSCPSAVRLQARSQGAGATTFTCSSSTTPIHDWQATVWHL